MAERQEQEMPMPNRKPPLINWIAAIFTLIAIAALLVLSIFILTEGLPNGQDVVLISATIVSTIVGILSVLLNFFQWRATADLSDAPNSIIAPSNLTEQRAILNTTAPPAVSFTSPGISRCIDWGDAPVLEQFYGRTQELSVLTRWLQEDRCRVVAIQGIGGVGKTTLARMLAKQVQTEFTYVFWRSLHNVPPLKDILAQCLQLCSPQQQPIHLPEETEAQIRLLLEQLRLHRCLLVLDNFESVLQEGRKAGAYLPEYQDFGRLLELIGASEHQSSLIITTREKPRELALLEGKLLAVRTIPLYGVEQAEGQAMLQSSGLFGTDAAWQHLISSYSGNPLALKLVSEPVRELFQGDIAAFLEQQDTLLSDVQELLEQQFLRLSPREQAVLYWLAIEREVLSLHELQADMFPAPSRGELLEALNSLRRRCMIESVSAARFALQPVILEYITNRFIQHIGQEIETGMLALLESHVLLKAQARDYTRQNQLRLILAPVAERLIVRLGSTKCLQRLKELYNAQRHAQYPHPGYAIGNILNLLLHMGTNLCGEDFSHLEIRQAYLQGATLTDVNFAHAHFINCVFTETFGRVLSLALTPDQTILAAGTAAGNIELWRFPEGTPLQTLRGHTDWIRCLACSSAGLLASTSDDASIRIWDIHTTTCLQTLHGHQGRVYAVAWSPDNRLLASGGDDQIIRLWNITTGQCIQTFQEYRGRIRTLAFHPNASFLACGGVNQGVLLLDIDNKKVSHRLQEHGEPVYTIAFHAQGHLLATGGDDRTIRLWNAATGQQLAVLQGHTGRVQSLAFHPVGTMLASGSIDQTVRLWDVQRGTCLKVLHEHSNGVRAVVCSPDGQWLVSGGQDQTVRLWDVQQGRCLKTLLGHSSWVYSVAYSPDGSLLANDYEDQSIHLWNTASGEHQKILRGHTSWVYAVTFDRSGRFLVSGGDDQTVRLWDVQSGQCCKVLTGHSGRVRSVAFSPTGQLVASGSDDQTVRLWDRVSGQCIRVLQKHEDRIRSVSFSRDGSLLASAGEDTVIYLWDISTGQCYRNLRGHAGRTWTVAFANDDRLLISGGDDQCIRIWQIETEECIQILTGHTARIYTIAISPDGNYLASGSEDQTIRLWDLQTGECQQALSGHSSRIRGLSFNPDGETLASGSHDGTIRIWNWHTGNCLSVLCNDKPYERMNITEATGITAAQRAMLTTLGAIETPEGHSTH